MTKLSGLMRALFIFLVGGALSQTSEAVAQGATGGRGAGAPIPSSSSDAPSLEFVSAADSIYALGRRALNEEQYEQAIALFAVVAGKFPTAYVTPNAWYWRAYSQHRLGVNRRDTSMLHESLNSISMHRTLYRNSQNRGDVTDLYQRVRSALIAAGDSTFVPNGEDRNVRGDYVDCSRPVEANFYETLKSLDSLSPEVAAGAFDRVLFGFNLCGDVSAASNLYARIATNRTAREQVIAALGRSRHSTARKLLNDIVESEQDASLKEQARAWLSMRGS